jgi:hypothetical protein
MCTVVVLGGISLCVVGSHRSVPRLTEQHPGTGIHKGHMLTRTVRKNYVKTIHHADVSEGFTDCLFSKFNYTCCHRCLDVKKSTWFKEENVLRLCVLYLIGIFKGNQV